ncbi:hypothetical protein BDQ12DRAFT_721475 [Crucibulum laeve]|uniref:UBC core domain-containing protein n=1 Tax=Crucibulum laeve TaxID=68775 RepID=A0A5C3M857_9AGAR|nr:hypothetical protein BDQ12DRAFT_721475 [Crucibulum laeve]
MAAPNSHRLLSRLYQDLAELQEQPYPGVAVFTDDANIRRFCLVLTPPSGPWKDLSLHFEVLFPENWPTSPPSISSSVHGIDHPNLFDGYICCDLLKEHFHFQQGYTGGYTPALTLRGLFLQFLTFFSGNKVEQEHGEAFEVGDHMLINYVLETDLASQMNPMQSHLYCHGTSTQTQTQLEEAWKANPSPEIVVSNYAVRDGERAIHTVKEADSHPDRIHRFEQPNPRWSSTLKLISQWKCQSCSYGSNSLSYYRTPNGPAGEAMDVDDVYVNPLFKPPTTCLLDTLNNDILLEIAEYMPSETLVCSGKAYSRFHELVTSMHVLLRSELRCFFLRTPLSSNILGIGIAYDAQQRMLSSDFDWLSKDAFDYHGVRKSIEKRSFKYFLPLAFNRAHFDRARVQIWQRLAKIDTDIRSIEIFNRKQPKGGRLAVQAVPIRQPHDSVGVIYKMMNNIVVSLMKTCDDVSSRRSRDQTGRGSSNGTLLHASEKAVISYCHLFHLLISLCRSTPAVLHDATVRLQRFILQPASRTKAQVPDIGELIVLVTLVLAMPPISKGAPVTWETLNGPFLQEAIVRNVRWVLKEAPELELPEKGASDYRLSLTFQHSKTSLRLIMFQIAFLDMFIKTYASDLSRLDDNYGFAEKDLPERMVEEIKNIYKVVDWPDFFRRVRYARGAQFTKSTFSDMLREAVQMSGDRQYHIALRGKRLDLMYGPRAQKEQEYWRTKDVPPN